MTITEFIRTHHVQIVSEFETFARANMPLDRSLSAVELRDHAHAMLIAAADDIESDQTSKEQSEKGKGLGEEHAMMTSANLHAQARMEQGFSPSGVLAEFRALRSSVLRLYEQTGNTDLVGVRRFNESIDEALTVSLDRFEELSARYRDQFIGILGHDLRNPLAAITAGAGFLIVSADGNERQATTAGRILSSALRMGRMIRDLLDFTSARLGGAIPLTLAPIDVARICEEGVLEVQTASPAAVVQFESSGDLNVEWDGDRMAQVISNLLSNAVQYGDGTPVSLVARGAADEVVLAVHNDGPPIPVDVRRDIFEPLARGTSVHGRGLGNIGLGLFIARAIVRSHEGEVEVESSDTQGTTFTVRIPRKVGVASPQPPPG